MTNPETKDKFEAALEELEGIVEQLEKGDLPLEQSLELFERGIGLTRTCQKRLEEAERKVEALLQDQDGEQMTVPFEEVDQESGPS